MKKNDIKVKNSDVDNMKIAIADLVDVLRNAPYSRMLQVQKEM